MLCNCVNIKVKKFKCYYNFIVQLYNNYIFNNLFTLLEASYNIKEDFVLIVCNIIVTLYCYCFKYTFLNTLQYISLVY